MDVRVLSTEKRVDMREPAVVFFFSRRRRHTRFDCDWSSDVCSSDLQMLAKDVWREPHRATPLDNLIDVHVAHLRRKIDEGSRVKLIHTVRGVGFVLREESPA